MIRVYIAHALHGDWAGGIAAVRQFAFAAARRGYMPIAPHVLMDGILEDMIPEERALGMRLGMEQLDHCHEIWLCGAVVSEGMEAERRRAVKAGLLVRLVASLADIP